MQWLHDYRKREIELIFRRCPEKLFQRGLELGAGDGYQSTLLSKYSVRLISTEPNGRILTRENTADVEYLVCSAETALERFDARSFDVVFSSNLLEHVNDPLPVLRSIHRVLKDNGITIHVIPGPFWKVCQMALHVPVTVMVTLERIMRAGKVGGALKEIKDILRETWQGITTGSNSTIEYLYEKEMAQGNNPGISRERPSFWAHLVLPRPHGVSRRNADEMEAFSRRRWLQEFDRAGFECLAVRKGPVASGYGLGWHRIVFALETMGLASEFIYVAAKKGYPGNDAGFFI